MKQKQQMTEYITNNPQIIKQIVEQQQNELTTHDMLLISKYMYTYHAIFFNNPYVKNINVNEDKKSAMVTIDNEVNDIMTYNVNNPLEIEDLKFYM